MEKVKYPKILEQDFSTAALLVPAPAQEEGRALRAESSPSVARDSSLRGQGAPLRKCGLRQARLPGLPEADGMDEGLEPSKHAGGLTPKQRRFVDEYLLDFNATAAMRRAGYRTDHRNARQLRQHPAIQAALAERFAERRAQSAELEARIVQELCRIAFADPRGLMRWGPEGVELVPSEELSPEQAAGVAEISAHKKIGIRLKKHDKIKALELLGRHIGMFTDRVQNELSGPGGGPLREDRRILVRFVGGPEQGRACGATSGPDGPARLSALDDGPALLPDPDAAER